METLLENFESLIHVHHEACFEFIERHPDIRFLPKLLEYHREGEHAMAKLIQLICLAHEVPLPEAFETNDLHELVPDQLFIPLTCLKCRASYHYEVEQIYYESEVLDQNRLFQTDDLWTPENIFCKRCQSTLPFNTPKDFRTKLFTELMTAELLKLPEVEQGRLKHVKPLRFPRLKQKSCNPNVFLFKVAEARIEFGSTNNYYYWSSNRRN